MYGGNDGTATSRYRFIAKTMSTSWYQNLALNTADASDGCQHTFAGLLARLRKKYDTDSLSFYRRWVRTRIDKDLRDFGHTVGDVTKYAGAYVQGLQSTGAIACFKHFPGLGDVPADLDPHSTLPTVNADKDHIYNVNLATFKHFIQSTNPQEQADMIMATDVLMPDIDPKFPAELSHTFITDILRTQFGYDGVVISDSLHLQGVAIDGQHLSIGDAAVLAIQAGIDMALNVTGPAEVTEVINALKAALQNGTITQIRIEEAVTRIITLKMERHLMPGQ